MTLIWKKKGQKSIFDLLFTFLFYKGKLQKKILQHISHSHTYVYFAQPIDFLALPILEKRKYEFIRYGSLWSDYWC